MPKRSAPVWPGNPHAETTTFGGLSRSQLMSKVRSHGNTTTEHHLMRLLRRARIAGWRRRSSLPGHPDFVWKAQKVVVFVDGCFWHGHSCGRNLTPATNRKVWLKKISQNQLRDRRVSRKLRRAGWSVIRIWECKLAKRPDFCTARIQKALGQMGTVGTFSVS